jgi:hypothetical protein
MDCLQYQSMLVLRDVCGKIANLCTTTMTNIYNLVHPELKGS